MQVRDTLRKVDETQEKVTLQRLDGLVAGIGQGYLYGQANGSMKGFAVGSIVSMFHTLMHESLEGLTCGWPRKLQTWINSVAGPYGRYLPVDGVVGTILCYFLNGWWGAFLWIILHGPIHMQIFQEHLVILEEQ